MSGPGRGGLLRRHRDFRLLWCGEVAGKFGGSVTAVTMPLIAVSRLRASTFEVGLLSAAAWLPWLVIGLPAGAWVDRLRRRPIMLLAAAVSVLLYAVVPLAAWTGRLNIGVLLTVALLTGTATVFFQTAYSAYLPSILEAKDQPEGNAKLHGSASAAQIAGLGSAGLIAQAVGAVNGILATAGTFVIAIFCLTNIRYREPVPVLPEDRSPALFGQVWEGLRLVADDRWLRSLTLFGAVSNFALMGYQSIQVVFLIDDVGLRSATVGGLIAAASAGGVFGALIARRVTNRIGTARAAIVFELGITGFALLIPITFGGFGVLFFAVGGFSVSAGVVAGNVIWASFRQRYCPPELLGRITASSAFLNLGTVPLGALFGGTMGAVLGLRTALWVTTAGVPLAGLVLLFSPVGRARDLPTARRPDPHLAANPTP